MDDGVVSDSFFITVLCVAGAALGLVLLGRKRSYGIRFFGGVLLFVSYFAGVSALFVECVNSYWADERFFGNAEYANGSTGTVERVRVLSRKPFRKMEITEHDVRPGETVRFLKSKIIGVEKNAVQSD